MNNNKLYKIQINYDYKKEKEFNFKDCHLIYAFKLNNYYKSLKSVNTACRYGLNTLNLYYKNFNKLKFMKYINIVECDVIENNTENFKYNLIKKKLKLK